MRCVSWLVLLGLLTLAAAGHARAQPMAAAEPIRLDLLDCKLVSSPSVRELVALEVAPRPLLAAAGGGVAATRAEVSCIGGVAHIRVEDGRLTAPLHLELAMRGMDRPARSRLLALTVAELIATSRLQRSSSANAAAGSGARVATADVASASNAALRSEPANARAGASDVDVGAAPDRDDVSLFDGADASEEVPLRWGAQVWLGVGAARVAEPSMIAPAAAGGVSMYWRALALNADLRFEHAQATRSIAELKLDSGSFAVVPAWRVHGRTAELSIGPGVRVGYASLRANALEAGLVGQAVNGFWIAPCAQVALQLRFAQRWAMRVGAELAYITRTLRGIDPSGASVLELRDLALAAQLGMSWDAVAAR